MWKALFLDTGDKYLFDSQDKAIAMIGDSKGLVTEVELVRSDKLHVANSIIAMVEELDVELDGVALPATAAAIANRLRSLLEEMDELAEGEEC